MSCKNCVLSVGQIRQNTINLQYSVHVYISEKEVKIEIQWWKLKVNCWKFGQFNIDLYSTLSQNDKFQGKVDAEVASCNWII